MTTDPQHVPGGAGGRGRPFRFRDSWRVEASPPEVHAVLLDLEHYPAWWPQVVAVAKVDDDTARVLCRSTLPYTLDLLLHAVHREPERLETAVSGDLSGSVRWRLVAEGTGTRLDFEQQVRVARRGLAVASYVARPVLRWNHDQMMAGCRSGLAARLPG